MFERLASRVVQPSKTRGFRAATRVHDDNVVARARSDRRTPVTSKRWSIDIPDPRTDTASLGGIAVHLARLVPKLQRAGLNVGVLNHFRSTAMPFVVGALNKNP